MDADFDLLRVGTSGRVVAVPHIDDAKLNGLPHTTVPIGLPPVLPTVTEELEKYLKDIEKLPIHDYERAQKFWPRKGRAENLLAANMCPVQTAIVVDRNPTTGELLGFKEAELENSGHTAKNSLSLKRIPGPLSASIRGSSTNYPFWPGGLDEPSLEGLVSDSTAEDVDFVNNLLTVPVGFDEGMDFNKPSHDMDSDDKQQRAEPSTPTLINLTDILTHSDEIEFSDEDSDDRTQEDGNRNQAGQDDIKEEVNIEGLSLEDVVKETGDEKKEEATVKVTEEPKEEWAVPVDISTPVDDFHKQIPDMAYKWPFELDTFQKQAILHLENHDSVFVAAHTSAGKTVVAEYAIALAMKHMTRTIYTSPIKALSNQKFRDFKQTFGDVGLITGDVQIMPEAACLIMTTEILRSMLYNGSDVIRDLEWVIFDEVHYINDVERGVVWEEVLIMLPPHVNIILLSATVPNTLEFAGWVGRTKKRKVYVISTVKRPVPLEHYLYTGNNTKTSNELFMILDANRNFLTRGYNKAVDAKKERASKSSQSYGPKGPRAGNPHQDKNVWLSIIEMLRKKDQMPVVAFTFSKKKIDENSNNLTSVDLTNASEKSEIHIFFQKCISRLRGSDKELPQVTHMQEMLKRGIGIHHSGVLPILKEVVELLFCRGLVKILFATETFAMGVNMPARTVVFDSIRKHDGKSRRDLLTGEYIQMAGRSGRRGLDKTGMVIILCKGDVPEISDLHKMMLGKPTTLESQFRLTYSMILNLLRVEQLRVEDMMKRSFSEFHSQNKMSELKKSLEELSEKVKNLKELSPFACGGDLEDYYDACKEYHQLKAKLQKIMISHPQAVKALSAGRVIVVDNQTHRNALGVILQSSPASNKERTFTALVICEQANNASTAADSSGCGDSSFPRPMTDIKLFRPEGPCGHQVAHLRAEDISVITTKTLKIAADRIIDDYKKRQQPRFRNDPPGQSTSVATQELLRIVEANPQGLCGLDPVGDLHIRDIDLVDDFQRMQFLYESFDKFRCIHSPDFLECFNQLRENRMIKEEHRKLQFLMSDESLQLLPEYQQRIQVLKSLKYLDPVHNTVELKGRVACEISQHELIITELVFQNEMNGLHPNEIAALLSCVVFEQKHCSEPELAPDLVQAKDKFVDLARKIGTIQKECGVRIPVEDYADQFKFGLMEVVFEWARGMPFSEIIKLTDVQEGIIVRCIQRLDEVLIDVRNAARIVGDPILFTKMEEASRNIKRDIVFAASLYTQ